MFRCIYAPNVLETKIWSSNMKKQIFETILKCLVFQSVIALLNTHHSLGSLNTLSTLEKRESFLQHWRERESMDNLRNHTIGQRQI